MVYAIEWFKMDIDKDICLILMEPSLQDEYVALVNRNRDHLTRWLPWVNNMQSKEDAVTFIERTRKQWFNHEGFTAGIMYRGKLCGVAGYNSLNRKQKHVALGYWLDKDHQGKGIMTKVVAYLLHYAFTAMDMNRVEVRTEVDNSKSRAIPERLGFIEEGVARQSAIVNGCYIDHMIYSLLKSEWKKMQFG